YWPDQNGSGVHVNISGAGVVRHADNADGAVRLLEWLSSVAAQEEFAGLNLEYPANPDVPVDPQVAAWGGFRQNLINVSRAGELQARAVRLMDRAGYH
ncbi:MAG: Fe(3+) ABC transporter substrate-binding protein, partial [Gammaproteobacteria bacterium]|nr:Fe(3+) ABC transporter substrate-binding protein [Gammaproteobacteria bacterium]